MWDVINVVLIPALVTGSLYALVATGFNVLERTTRIFNFGQGDLITVAPTVALVGLAILQWPAWASLLLGVGATMVLALVVEYLAVRPYVDQAQRYLWILSTLGASVMIQQALAQPFYAQPVQFPLGFAQDSMFPLVQWSVQQSFILVSAIGTGLVLMVIYSGTSLGRMLIAVGEDPDGARALGLSVGRMSQLAMVLSAATAVIAGLAVAPTTLISPQFGFSLTFVGFVAASLGGLGSIRGGYLAGYLISLLVQVVSFFVGGGWTNTAIFSALLVLYVFRPWGIFGRRPIRQV